MTDYTLDKAKQQRGQWLPIDDRMEACLDWSIESGWVLAFRSSETKEVLSTLKFHRRRGIQGESWPGNRPLQELRTLARRSGNWSDHAPKRPERPIRYGGGWHAGAPF